MIKRVFSIFLFSASFFIACVRSPQEETPERRYERLAAEIADLKLQTRELEEKTAALKSAKEAAEREASEWQRRSEAIEKKLHALQPEVLPSFEVDDLRNNKVVLQRVYSIRTGQCFNERGEPSCLYLELNEGSSTDFVLYKANRLFLDSSKPTGLHNSYGQSLSIVTADIAKKLLEWETKGGDRHIRLESY